MTRNTASTEVRERERERPFLKESESGADIEARLIEISLNILDKFRCRYSPPLFQR